MSNLRLTWRDFANALAGAKLATVGVVIEHVSLGANFASWWRLETNWENKAAQDADLVGHGDRLEPHLLHLVVRLIFLVNLLVERSKILLVHVSGRQKQRIPSGVGRERLVEWVVTDDVRVVGEAGRDVVPVGDKLVRDAILVLEEVAER